MLRCFDSGSALQTVALPYRISMSSADNMKDQKFMVIKWHMSAFELSSWNSDYVTYKRNSRVRLLTSSDLGVFFSSRVRVYSKRWIISSYIGCS
jgi:hypothetical protein